MIDEGVETLDLFIAVSSLMTLGEGISDDSAFSNTESDALQVVNEDDSSILSPKVVVAILLPKLLVVMLFAFLYPFLAPAFNISDSRFAIAGTNPCESSSSSSSSFYEVG